MHLEWFPFGSNPGRSHTLYNLYNVLLSFKKYMKMIGTFLFYNIFYINLLTSCLEWFPFGSNPGRRHTLYNLYNVLGSLQIPGCIPKFPRN